MEELPTKTRLRADYGSDHELLIAQFRLKLKKVGKITRPFRYDLNQISFHLPSTSTTLPRFWKCGLFSLFSFHQKHHQLREKDPAIPLYIGPLHYVHHLPWFISGCYFSLCFISILVLLNVFVPSLSLPPPALNMNSGAHSWHCRGLGIGYLMHNY